MHDVNDDMVACGVGVGSDVNIAIDVEMNIDVNISTSMWIVNNMTVFLLLLSITFSKDWC